MTQLPAWAYVAVFVATVLLTLALTPVAMINRVAVRRARSSGATQAADKPRSVSRRVGHRRVLRARRGHPALAVLPRTGLPPMAVFLRSRQEWRPLARSMTSGV